MGYEALDGGQDNIFMINFAIILIYTAFSLGILKVFHRTKRANPIYWFVIFQWIMATGTFTVLDLGQDADNLYLALYFVALIAFSAGALSVTTNTNYQSQYRSFFEKPLTEPRLITRYGVIILALFSTLVTVGYYWLVGYNLFWEALTGSSIYDFKSARLATYSGENYYAPGFVNQFKNTLLVVCWATVLTWMHREKRTLTFRLISPIVILFLLYALLGTGQRAPMVYAFLMVMFGISLIAKIDVKRAIIFFLSLSFLFGFFSVLNERIEKFSILSPFVALASRVFINDQQEGLFAFRELANRDSVWFSDWWQGFLGLSPWSKGSSLNHDIYLLIHGTDRGTAGVTSVASAYYNGGFLTVIIFYALLGICYALLFRRFLSGPKTVLRCYTYGAIFFILSIYISGPPVVLFNKGIVALFLLLLLGKLSVSSQN